MRVLCDSTSCKFVKDSKCQKDQIKVTEVVPLVHPLTHDGKVRTCDSYYRRREAWRSMRARFVC